MRKVFTILFLLTTIIVFGQGTNPSFVGTTFPALVPATVGRCEVQIFNANTKNADSTYKYKPMKMEFFPTGSPTVISKDSIMTDLVEIYNIPVGLFSFKLTFHNNTALYGNCQIATKLPDGTIIYSKATFMKYPDSK